MDLLVTFIAWAALIGAALLTVTWWLDTTRLGRRFDNFLKTILGDDS